MLIRDHHTVLLLRSLLLSGLCLLLSVGPSAAGFGSKKFMKGLVLGHALGMKKFIHFPPMHHHHMPHMPTFMPYPVPYPVPPMISPIGSSIATSSVAVATPNALALPMVAPGIGGIMPTAFANGGFGVNGFGLAGGAAINPFGLNLLPQGVVSPFGINPFGVNAFGLGTGITNSGTIVNPSGFAFAGNPNLVGTGVGVPSANIFVG